MSDAADLAMATSLFKRFQGRYREPRKEDLVLLGGMEKPVTCLLVGTALTIGYKALGDGKDYRHEFASPLPQLYVSADGRQAYFVGGGYRFSERGFIR